MLTVRQRIRRIRRAARAAQAFAVLWALTEVGFIALGAVVGDIDLTVSHVFAFGVAVLMAWVMSTAAKVFHDNLVDAAMRARAAGVRDSTTSF